MCIPVDGGKGGESLGQNQGDKVGWLLTLRFLMWMTHLYLLSISSVFEDRLR